MAPEAVLAKSRVLIIERRVVGLAYLDLRIFAWIDGFWIRSVRK